MPAPSSTRSGLAQRLHLLDTLQQVQTSSPEAADEMHTELATLCQALDIPASSEDIEQAVAQVTAPTSPTLEAMDAVTKTTLTPRPSRWGWARAWLHACFLDPYAQATWAIMGALITASMPNLSPWVQILVAAGTTAVLFRAIHAQSGSRPLARAIAGFKRTPAPETTTFSSEDTRTAWQIQTVVHDPMTEEKQESAHVVGTPAFELRSPYAGPQQAELWLGHDPLTQKIRMAVYLPRGQYAITHVVRLRWGDRGSVLWPCREQALFHTVSTVPQHGRWLSLLDAEMLLAYLEHDQPRTLTVELVFHGGSDPQPLVSFPVQTLPFPAPAQARAQMDRYQPALPSRWSFARLPDEPFTQRTLASLTQLPLVYGYTNLELHVSLDAQGRFKQLRLGLMETTLVNPVVTFEFNDAAGQPKALEATCTRLYAPTAQDFQFHLPSAQAYARLYDVTQMPELEAMLRSGCAFQVKAHLSGQEVQSFTFKATEGLGQPL